MHPFAACGDKRNKSLSTWLVEHSADEEGGKSNGVEWLLKNRRDLVDAKMVFNHDGGGILSDRSDGGYCLFTST
jgi:hypothetical protein